MQGDASIGPATTASHTSSWFFKLLLGMSALFIAGCSAFFSVRGLGLLFIGSATAVMVMAASLEVGKLVAASFLYRYWSQITIPLRIYLTLAVLLLIAITSLGNYGYLARAYEKTHTQIAVLQQQIQAVQQDADAAQGQIDSSKNQLGKLTDNGREDRDKLQSQVGQINQTLETELARLEDRRKAAKDKQDHDVAALNTRLPEAAELLKSGLASEDEAVAKLNEAIAVLDRAVDAYTAQGGPGFLKHDGIKKGQLLRQQQQPQRDAIAAEITGHQQKQDQLRAVYAKSTAAVSHDIAVVQEQYRQDLTRFDGEEKDLRKSRSDAIANVEKGVASLQAQDRTVTTVGKDQVAGLYLRIESDNQEIARLRDQIAGTDIGSYRFVARAFNAPTDDLVKWLVLLLVMVFDPLAVTLTVGLNVALVRDRRVRQTMQSASAALAAGVGPDGAAMPARPSRTRRLLVTAATLAIILGIAAGAAWSVKTYGPSLLAQWQHTSEAKQVAQLVPPDSFAVLAVHPARMGSAGTDQIWSKAVTGLFGKSAMNELANLFGTALDANADVYAFVKYPSHQEKIAQTPTPVMLCGMVAEVKDRAAAEIGLCRFADAFAASLRPAGTPGESARLHPMVHYGRGHYLDPQGGFLSFALTDHQAIVLLEIDGDPAKPAIENEIRLALAQNDSPDSLAGATRAQLPPRALANDSAVALWFDAARCFADMPKNTAAQARYQQLQGRVNFDLLLTFNPTAQGQLAVVADYNYAGERFKALREPSIQDVLSKLGPADAAGVPGRLIDRCAITLDIDPLMDRLQLMMAGSARDNVTQVRVEKSIASTREGSFKLVAQFDPQAGFPLETALRSLVR